jgi:hypothetical protein
VTTRDEALERARAWVGGSDQADIGIHEFDLGYVVWGVEPEPAGDAPPSTIGSARGVIDRETGELTLWPALPADAVAEEYRRAHQAAARFPAEVAAQLRAAGWYPGRSVDDELARFAATVRGLSTESALPVEPFPAAEAILREFGGIRVPNGSKFPFAFHPAEPVPEAEDFEGLGYLIGKAVYPVGVREDDGPSHLVVDEDGRLYLHHWAGSFALAPTVEEAIVALTRGVGDELPRVTGPAS